MTVIPFPYRHSHNNMRVDHFFELSVMQTLPRLPRSMEGLRLLARFDNFKKESCDTFIFLCEYAEKLQNIHDPDGLCPSFHPYVVAEHHHFTTLKELWDRRIALSCEFARAATAPRSEIAQHPNIQLVRLST